MATAQLAPAQWRSSRQIRRGDLSAASSTTDCRSWISQNKNSGDAWESPKARRSASGEGPSKRASKRGSSSVGPARRSTEPRPTQNPRSLARLHRSIDEFGLPCPGTALDHDGASGPRAHLLKPTFDDGELCLAASKGQGVLGHVRSRISSEVVAATGALGAAWPRPPVGSAITLTATPSVASERNPDVVAAHVAPLCSMRQPAFAGSSLRTA